MSELDIYLMSPPGPRWRLRGFRDKYILRVVGERYLPREIAWRRKVMFRAPMNSFFASAATSGYVAQLLSEASLRTSGIFKVDRVKDWQARICSGRVSWRQRTMIELGMVGVLSTQLWYHTFIAPLADLPSAPIPPHSDVPGQAGDRTAAPPALATGRL